VIAALPVAAPSLHMPPLARFCAAHRMNLTCEESRYPWSQYAWCLGTLAALHATRRCSELLIGSMSLHASRRVPPVVATCKLRPISRSAGFSSHVLVYTNAGCEVMSIIIPMDVDQRRPCPPSSRCARGWRSPTAFNDLPTDGANTPGCRLGLTVASVRRYCAAFVPALRPAMIRWLLSWRSRRLRAPCRAALWCPVRACHER